MNKGKKRKNRTLKMAASVPAPPICNLRPGTRDDGLETISSLEQLKVEGTVSEFYKRIKGNKFELRRDLHIDYLKEGLVNLSQDFECLDASRPWLCYWIVHALSLFGYTLEQDLSSRIVQFLNKCQAPSGGYGGGPGQLPHLAPTYAAVLALCELGTEEAFRSIDRPALQRFISSLHQEDGSFLMHDDGEVDIRALYCAAVPAVMTNIMLPEMFSQSEKWLASCQSYEGGFGACPGTEAHGGYAFCGYAASLILNSQHLINHKRLLHWACHRQMSLEGGFQGRTNKLVDSCYSFWVGGLLPLLSLCLKYMKDPDLDQNSWFFDEGALQQYILCCCQHPLGGLRDKPGKGHDFYHSCYSLSGLSLSQHNLSGCHVTSMCTDTLQPTHPLYNITMDKCEEAIRYFKTQPKPNIVTTSLE